MIKVNLTHIKPNLYLDIEEVTDNTLSEISEGEAMEHGEAKIQLKEGCSYEYQFSDEKTVQLFTRKRLQHRRDLGQVGGHR